METEEFNNLNRDKLFEELRGKCKKLAKRDFYGWLIGCCILVIPFFFISPRLDSPKNIFFFTFLIVIICLGSWFALFNFRFLKKFDTLDTPDRLLTWLEKKHRYNLILWLVACICLIGSYFASCDFSIGTYLGAAVLIVFIVIIFCGGGPLWYLKEKLIIEQLQELVDKK